MREYKRLTCFLVALTLMLSLVSPAFSADAENAADSLGLCVQEESALEESEETAEPSNQEKAGQPIKPNGMIIPGQEENDGIKFLTGLRVYDYDAGLLLMANVGDNLSGLDLPQELACYVEGRAAWDVYWCPVDWQYDLVDNTSPGRSSIPGILQPEEGYALKEGFSEEVFYTAVILCAENMQTEALSRIEFNLKQKGYLVALGDDMPEKLQPASAWCYTERNESYLAEVRWDFNGVDTSAMGVYPVSGQLLLPPCLDLPEGETGEYSSFVYVVNPGRIDLTAVIRDTDTEIYIEWLYRVPNPADMVVEYAVDDPEGDWTPNTDYPYQGYPGGTFLYGTYNAVSLTIKKDKLSPETDYYFRIRYGDEFSNLLQVNPGGEIPEEPENLITLESVNAIMCYELKIFPTETDPATFGLPAKVWCTYYGRYNVECDVVWDTAFIDTARPGWACVKGVIAPPQGYRIEEGFAAYYPVMLTEDGMMRETLDKVFVREQLFLVGKDTENSDASALEDIVGFSLQEKIEYVTRDGLHGAAPVSWDISGLDTSKVGRYPIHGTMELPQCFALPENADLSVSSIQVMESDRIDLSGFKMDNSMNRVGSCHWLYTVEDIENITLEYAVGVGDWRQTTAELDIGEMWVNEIPCRYGSNRLTIQFSSLEDGEYYFRLTYQEQLSNTLHITVDKSTAVDWDIGGDRGGADQETQKPPDIEQPAPDPGKYDGRPGGQPGGQITEDSGTQLPSPGSDSGDNDSADDPLDSEEADGRIVFITSDPVPQARSVGAEGTISQIAADINEYTTQIGGLDSAQGEVMREYSTETVFSISGLRLRAMLASAGETVLFEKQGVSVELPADFLAGLEIADNSRFTVRIERGDNAFTLVILLDEVPLSALPPTVIGLPFSFADGVDWENLACFDAQSREVSAAVYDAVRQIIWVEIQATGSYTIAERAAIVSPLSAQTSDGNMGGGHIDEAGGDSHGWLIFTIAGIVATAMYACFALLRRRRAAEVGGGG